MLAWMLRAGIIFLLGVSLLNAVRALQTTSALSYLASEEGLPQPGAFTKATHDRLTDRFAKAPDPAMPIFGVGQSLGNFTNTLEYANDHLILSYNYSYPSCVVGTSNEGDVLYIVDRGEPYRNLIKRTNDCIEMSIYMGVSSLAIFVTLIICARTRFHRWRQPKP